MIQVYQGLHFTSTLAFLPRPLASTASQLGNVAFTLDPLTGGHPWTRASEEWCLRPRKWLLHRQWLGAGGQERKKSDRGKTGCGTVKGHNPKKKTSAIIYQQSFEQCSSDCTSEHKWEVGCVWFWSHFPRFHHGQVSFCMRLLFLVCLQITTSNGSTHVIIKTTKICSLLDVCLKLTICISNTPNWGAMTKQAVGFKCLLWIHSVRCHRTAS